MTTARATGRPRLNSVPPSGDDRAVLERTWRDPPGLAGWERVALTALFVLSMLPPGLAAAWRVPAGPIVVLALLALVAAQDTGLMTVGQSKEHVAQEFDITEAQLRQIEEEGLEKEWPPLDEAAQPAIGGTEG